jgi:hypothetical protein
VASSHVWVDPQVPRLVDSIHGIPSIAFEFRPAASTDGAPVAVRIALEAVFTKLDWLDDPAPLAFPGIELLPGGCLLVFDYVDNEQIFSLFLTHLVYELEQAGWSGALLPPPGVRLAIDMPHKKEACLTAGLAFDVDLETINALPREVARSGWYVSTELTHRVLDNVMDWLSVIDGATWYYTTSGHNVSILPSQAPDLIVRSLPDNCSTALTAATHEQFRRVQFASVGHVTFEIGNVRDDWEADLATLVDVLRAGAADARYGFVRRCVAPQPGWRSSLFWIRPFPLVSENYYGRSPGVESSYVPDAYGIQLLHPSHMKRTGDLTRWNIEELTSGHCLISALNPAAWFEGAAPNDETLTAARRDFGEAIMDNELIEKHAYLDLT